MNAPLYTTEILRLAASLPDPVQLERSDGRSEQRSPTCGSRVVTCVQLDPDGRVRAISQQVQACAFGQASASLVAAHARGRSRGDVERALASLERWLKETGSESGWPEADKLKPARNRVSRHAAILLPFRALAVAMKDAGA